MWRYAKVDPSGLKLYEKGGKPPAIGLVSMLRTLIDMVMPKSNAGTWLEKITPEF